MKKKRLQDSFQSGCFLVFNVLKICICYFFLGLVGIDNGVSFGVGGKLEVAGVQHNLLICGERESEASRPGSRDALSSRVASHSFFLFVFLAIIRGSNEKHDVLFNESCRVYYCEKKEVLKTVRPTLPFQI